MTCDLGSSAYAFLYASIALVAYSALLFVDVAHREVVVGLGARGVFFGRDGFRVGKLLLWGLRRGSRTGDARQHYGKSNLSKVHRSPRNSNYPMRPKRGQKPNTGRFQSLGAPFSRMRDGHQKVE